MPASTATAAFSTMATVRPRAWAIIFAKWSTFRHAASSNTKFLRAFRKATGLDGVVAASEQFRPAPLVAVFDFGYEEIHRQVKVRGKLVNKASLERSLHLIDWRDNHHWRLRVRSRRRRQAYREAGWTDEPASLDEVLRSFQRLSRGGAGCR